MTPIGDLGFEQLAQQLLVGPAAIVVTLPRRNRGDGIKQIARELSIDRKTVKRWLRLGEWQPRRPQRRARKLDPFAEFIERRAPEVGFSGVVLHRELKALGFTGGLMHRCNVSSGPTARSADGRSWPPSASRPRRPSRPRSITVSCGRWIGAQAEKVHLFVFTLGYSRRLYAHAYRHERLTSLLDGHERAFRRFGGVTLTCLYDNPRTLVLGRREKKVLWHPQFEDFAPRYYGFTPRACQPYVARTKGKVENGVKYVKRNALAGRRFRSWEELNSRLERWSVEVADRRVHGVSHERPIDRFTHEQLTPLGTRRPIIMNECERAGSPTMPW